WQRAGKIVVTAATGLLAISGHGWTANALLRPLERDQTMLAPSGNLPPDLQTIRWVVVLGGGSSDAEDLPPTECLSSASLRRLVEGIRLQRALPSAQLVVSGGAVFSARPTGDVLRDAACALGVPPERVTAQPIGRNTTEEVGAMAHLVGREPFLLVTSAAHMSRALEACQAHQLLAIPAPTDFLSTEPDGVWTPGDLYPSGAGLHHSERAAYEYLGRWRRRLW
ncbi:MAG: ElyC/SanA/YdcF family protein, partial [Chloracidobacterium sp.]